MDEYTRRIEKSLQNNIIRRYIVWNRWLGKVPWILVKPFGQIGWVYFWHKGLILASPNADHALCNAFASIKRVHRNCCKMRKNGSTLKISSHLNFRIRSEQLRLWMSLKGRTSLLSILIWKWRMLFLDIFMSPTPQRWPERMGRG